MNNIDECSTEFNTRHYTETCQDDGSSTQCVEDLNIVRVKEGDVLVDTDSYSDEYLEDIINDLESVIERLEYLKGLE